MAESSQTDSEKTEDPTPARREDFRKRGQVAQTKELGPVLTLLGAAVFIYIASGYFLIQFRWIFNRTMGPGLVDVARNGNILEPVQQIFFQTSYVVLPVFLVFLLLGIASNVLQVGILQNEEAMKFNLQRINPVEGLKRLFSLKSLVEGIKAILKVMLVATVVLVIIRQEMFTVPSMLQAGVDTVFSYMGELLIKMLGAVGILMLIIAGLDYAFQRFELEQKMRMTKQEVKEETKAREGDPMVKARIRRIQREMSRKRMMEDVPKADVIITNPTHLAVAIKYDATMPAPQLIAKGADLIAKIIREVARENNIPIVENKPLARTIYKTMEIGHVIPRELYKAVAEVLSYVYRVKRKVMS